MNIWFKQQYVQPILDGTKTDTLRAKLLKNVQEGDILTASVGPRPAFALLQIIHIDTVKLYDLSHERRRSLRALYPDADTFYRYTFEATPA